MTLLFEWWSAVYSNHAQLRTLVEFVHIGGLLAGGGSAVAADVATISAIRQPGSARDAQLKVLERTHIFVVVGLVALSVSGVLLVAADLDTFRSSRVFWLKMGLVALLLGNGWLLMRGEQAARAGDTRAWSRLHRTAISSLVLWFLTTLIGAALPNLG
ncbi:MAG: hypothetical protein ABI652_02335 [Acidobacteriota bacterium]